MLPADVGRPWSCIVVVEVKNQEGMELLEKYVNKLTEIGFNLEINLENQVIVKAIPAILGDINAKEMLNIIDRLLEIEDTLPMEDKINKILATVACHWSIRAGREMRLATCSTQTNGKNSLFWPV